METEQLNPIAILRRRAGWMTIPKEEGMKLERAAQYLEGTAELFPNGLVSFTIFELYETANAAQA